MADVKVQTPPLCPKHGIPMFCTIPGTKVYRCPKGLCDERVVL